MEPITLEVIEDQKAEAVQAVRKARDLLEKQGGATDADMVEINKYLQLAEDNEKAVKQMTRLRELEMSQNEAAIEAEKAAQKTELDEKKKKEELAGFKGGGEYMQAIYNARKKGKWDDRLDHMIAKREQKDMSSTQGSTGGFNMLVQQEQSVLTARAETNKIRNLAMVIPMMGRFLSWSKLDLGQGAAGKSAFFGGIVVYRTAEAEEITETEAKFKEFTLEAKELHGYVEIPKSTIQDSPASLEAFYRGQNGFGGAFGWREEWEALRGDGVNQMLGALNAPCRIEVTRNAGADFQFVDAVTMLSKMLLSGMDKVEWWMSQSVMPKLFQMKDANNNYIWMPNAVNGMPERLLGHKINWTEKVPALGTKGDVMLNDFSWFVMGDREGFELDISEDFKFKSNMVAFRATERNHGAPWLDTYITLADGAGTVSPFVVLN